MQSTSSTTSKQFEFFKRYVDESFDEKQRQQLELFRNEMTNVCKKLEETDSKSHHLAMLIPRKFVISYQGVLVLAFEGFSNEMLEIKNKFSKEGGCQSLNDENMGSKWPKITLGCLKEGITLSKEQFKQLNDVCTKASDSLLKRWKPIDFQALSIVQFKCRDLSPKNCVQELKITMKTNQPIEFRFAEPSKESKDYVEDRVLSETFDLEKYYPKVASAGNRESHYIEPMANLKTELTSVLRISNQTENLGVIHEFQSLVESALGKNVYCFFADDCLHVTLKSIVPKLN